MTSDSTPAGGQDERTGEALGPVRVVVDLDAIDANVRALQRHAGGTPLLAVVKGDAYGHGLLPVARTARAAGAAWLGTAQLRESLRLRRGGIDGPILSWLHAPGADFSAALEADIDLGVSAPWALAEVEAAAAATGRVARVHLKIDTGLARNGAFAPGSAFSSGAGVATSPDPDLPLGGGAAELVELAARAQERGRLQVVGLMSHFAAADAPGDPSIAAQQEVFGAAADAAARAGLDIQWRHLANSAAVLTDPSARYDLVRPGLAMYGLSPVPDLGGPSDYGLVPAMRVEADVALVKEVPAGQGVSYGHTYTTTADTRVALLPIGYADGVPRHASGAGPASLRGRRFTIAGRVCMDQVVLDIGDLDARAGDVAVLFGDGRDGSPTAQDWAQAAGTISYEIVTRMSGRLPRVYVGGPAGADGSAA